MTRFGRNRGLRGVIAVAVALLACGTGEAPDTGEAQAVEEPVAAPEVKVAGGPTAKRLVAAGCDPAAEAKQYERFVEDRALAVLRWTGMEEGAANLRIPVYVVGVGEGAIRVRFLQFPMREHYMTVWLGSGHIEAAPESVFLLDPCSATLEPWGMPVVPEEAAAP